ncbi:hypothetical protein CU048_10780 [Beijerinckiaceae bacterium]|jgi:hypothetical protein|nr:hypothetical protein CU048_10780 [Beijerinckiaceae bacterium]
MKLVIALAAAMLLIAPAAFAQDPGESGRGSDKAVGPASENRDTAPYNNPPGDESDDPNGQDEPD